MEMCWMVAVRNISQHKTYSHFYNKQLKLLLKFLHICIYYLWIHDIGIVAHINAKCSLSCNLWLLIVILLTVKTTTRYAVLFGVQIQIQFLDGKFKLDIRYFTLFYHFYVIHFRFTVSLYSTQFSTTSGAFLNLNSTFLKF